MINVKLSNEKALLNLKEFCEYLGIGQTKAREILNNPRHIHCKDWKSAICSQSKSRSMA